MPEYRLFYCPYHDFFAIDNGKYIFFYNFAAGKTKTRQQEDAHDCQD